MIDTSTPLTCWRSPHAYLCLMVFITALTAPFSVTSNDDEISSGTMVFRTNDATSTMFGLPMESKATLRISGMIAVVELEQHFQNPSDQWIEGRYLFPLPENAAVDGMEIQIGERLIKSVIKEKEAAEAIYQRAKNEGKKAGLLKQHRPNLFSQQLANIAPNESIHVTLRYLQPVNYKDAVFSLRLPTTITPRYIPGQHFSSSANNHSEVTSGTTEASFIGNERIKIHDSGWGWAQATEQVPDAHLITPPMIDHSQMANSILSPLTVSIQLDAGLPLANIDSTYHNIQVRKDGQQHHIQLSDGVTNMDRDFILTWQAVSQASPKAAIFSETQPLNTENEDKAAAKEEYFSLLLLAPPTQQQNQQRAIPKETIFIIDTSGSMGGTSIQQAKTGLQFALKQLSSQDRFNIIEFNSNYSSFSPQPIRANQRNIKNASHFVNRLHASGGTEMLPPLQHAFKQSHKESHLKQIVFITDGSVGNEHALFSYIHQNLDSSRLFTIGIGSAPNSYFMRKAAEFGRGSFTYIGDLNEVNKKMADLFKQINRPMMRDITIDITNDKDVEFFPKQIPDLYDGEPLLISLRHTKKLKNMTIKGIYQNQEWQQTISLLTKPHHPGIAKLWARRKIESLMDEKIMGTAEDDIRQQVINVALTHQLMSAYTSFVAVEEFIRRPTNADLKKVAIPNAIAQGQNIQQVNYPQTATPLWLNIFIGSMSFLTLLFIKMKHGIHQIIK